MVWYFEWNVLFNDALNTFYLRLYGVEHMVKDHSDSERGNPLPPHGYSFRLTARVLLYAPSYRQDNTYHGICYTSRGALAGTRKVTFGRRCVVTSVPDVYIFTWNLSSPEIRRSLKVVVYQITRWQVKGRGAPNVLQNLKYHWWHMWENLLS